jgi:hypothetical protein
VKKLKSSEGIRIKVQKTKWSKQCKHAHRAVRYGKKIISRYIFSLSRYTSRHLEMSFKGRHEIALSPFTVFITIPANYIPFMVNFPGGFHQNILK